jgi:hypothetical protein
MPGGVISLGEIAGRTALLEVACDRCDRRGRIRTARLLAEHGADLPISELLRILAGCPAAQGLQPHDRCGAHFPQLPALLATSERTGRGRQRLFSAGQQPPADAVQPEARLVEAKSESL